MALSVRGFTPIPAFHADHADLQIIFVLNRAAYLEPVNDTWFAAHNVMGDDQNDTLVLYYADNSVSPLECVTEHQFCNPNLPSESMCTNLTPIDQISSDVPRLSLNPKQSATQERLFYAAYNSSLNHVLGSLQMDALLAPILEVDGISAGLPDNLWMLEVTKWHYIMMAYTQSLMVSYVTGPSNPDKVQYLIPPGTSEEQQRCDNQIITGTDYASFSILGIGIILGVGGFIILISLTFEPVVKLIRKWLKRGAYKQFKWGLAETLQLQRLVYESQGAGT